MKYSAGIMSHSFWYLETKNTAEYETMADSELKYELFFKLAEFAFYYKKSPKEADNFLSKLINSNVIAPSKKKIIEAKLMSAMLNTYMSDFPKSEEILSEVASILENNDRTGGLRRLEQEEFLIQQKVELARLKAHMGQYQEALAKKLRR